MVAEVQGGRPRRGDDPVRGDRRAHRGETGDVVGPVVHRVVRDVHDVVDLRPPGRRARRRPRAPGPSRDRQRRRDRRAGGGTCPDRSGGPPGAYDAPMNGQAEGPAGRHRPPDRRRVQPAPRPHQGRGAGAAPPARSSAACGGGAQPRWRSTWSSTGRRNVGLRGERIASGLIVRYSGARTGDDVILSLVDEIGRLGGAEASAAVLVVTDDRDLRHGLKMRGARTAGCAWLIGRLDRPSRKASTSVGNSRPPHQGGRRDVAPDAEDEDERAGSRAVARPPRGAILQGPRSTLRTSIDRRSAGPARRVERRRRGGLLGFRP